MDNWKRNLSYIFIVTGGVLALYQQSRDQPNQLLLILGLGMLIIGIYSTSRRIPEKKPPQQTDSEDDASV